MSSLTNPYDAPLTSYTYRPFDISQTLSDDTQNAGLYTSTPTKSRSPSLSNSNRVSKALKGKRVHMCEHPGCPKVFTRAEHRRRHELSHQSRKQYTCAYPGCGKAFHRSDYLNQHMSRHSSMSPNLGKSVAKGNRSRSTSIQEMQSQPIHSPPMPFQLEPNDYSQTWGSMDSSMTYAQYSPSQSQRNSPVSFDRHSSPDSYTNERFSSPMSNESYNDTPIQYPASGLPVELVSSIDNYLRSILKPEVFASSHPQMDHSMWNAESIEMDPVLTKPENPEFSLYSWPPVHSLSYDHALMDHHHSTCH
ncbi:uncharacterized protein N7511_009090 [Penicillium nucicola]|uniref:uncharacterized protein n=1 Tax=Penicillium nucicola TaxID=1850975 RepID=UPI0025459ABF|nr:uncharacterized protein N7511_009090 [Penicillium nucicola]KAJ5747394.1 hypothetical protein N7511_009090 [Penicillium nucicola]